MVQLELQPAHSKYDIGGLGVPRPPSRRDVEGPRRTVLAPIGSAGCALPSATANIGVVSTSQSRVIPWLKTGFVAGLTLVVAACIRWGSLYWTIHGGDAGYWAIDLLDPTALMDAFGVVLALACGTALLAVRHRR
jgi:hypothetical protein